MLRKYSLPPARVTRRLMAISSHSTGRRSLAPVKVRVTSAKPMGARFLVPSKMTFSIFAPRSSFALCSPSTQRMASTMLDLPQPFGPSTAVIPCSKLSSALFMKDLKPSISSLESRTLSPLGYSLAPRAMVQ